MKEAIENRISRRTFEKQLLTKEEVETIHYYLNELNKVSQLTMAFLEDGSTAFSSLAKSYGIFTNVHSLILLKGKKTDPNLKEKVGYYGEELVLRLTTLGLGTCWVGGTFDKEKLPIEKEETIICVIVVGKVKESTLKEKMIRGAVSKKRKSMQERLETDTDLLPQWLLEGMEAVILAPSAKNSQKTIFTYKNGEVCAKIADDYEFDLVDLGIAKRHFEIATNGKFKLGNGGRFKLNK